MAPAGSPKYGKVPSGSPKPETRSEGAVMDDKGFIGALFDFSFTSFITTKIIKILYILIGIGCVIWLISATIMQGFVGFIGGLIGAVVVFLFSRVYLELMIVLFQMADNLKIIAARDDNRTPDLPPLDPPRPEKAE